MAIYRDAPHYLQLRPWRPASLPVIRWISLTAGR